MIFDMLLFQYTYLEITLEMSAAMYDVTSVVVFRDIGWYTGMHVFSDILRWNFSVLCREVYAQGRRHPVFFTRGTRKPKA